MKKLLAILLTLILAFSCFGALGTTAMAEETDYEELIKSDFDKPLYDANDEANTSMWKSTGTVEYKADDGNGTTDYARLTGGSTARLYSYTAIVNPGNTYQISFKIRVPEDDTVVTEDFANFSSLQVFPQFALYQPGNTEAGERASAYYKGGQNDYAYSYDNGTTKIRRKAFKPTWTIGEYTFNRDGYSDSGEATTSTYYTYCKDADGNVISPNVLLKDWTTVTMTFTAINDDANQGPQVVAFEAKLAGGTTGLAFDFKDFSLVCTNNNTVTETILESDFEEDVASSEWYISGDVQSMTEDAGNFARLNTGDEKINAYVRSKTIKLIPGNEYTLTYSVRIPTESANYATLLAPTYYLSPECSIYIPNGVTSEDVTYTKNLGDSRFYANATSSVNRRKNMNFVWNVEGYETKARPGFSTTGYTKNTDLFYTLISTEDGTTPSSPNDVFSDWKKVTLEFTAEAETVGSTDPAFAVFQFRAMGSNVAANLIYDIKDITLTETSAKVEVINPEPEDAKSAYFYQGFEDIASPGDSVIIYNSAGYAGQNNDWATSEIILGGAGNGEKYLSLKAYSQQIFLPFNKEFKAYNTSDAENLFAKYYNFSLKWRLSADEGNVVKRIAFVGYDDEVTDETVFSNHYTVLAYGSADAATGEWQEVEFKKVLGKEYNNYGLVITYESADDNIDVDTVMVKTEAMVPGDYDLDGEVLATDVTTLAKYFAGWASELNADLADFDGNNGANLFDLVKIAQEAADWNVSAE